MMPHIWHRKTYKEKLDYHWHLLTSNTSHKRHYKHMCSLNVSKGICGADGFSYVNIYIHLIFMYQCMNLHVSTCWSIYKSRGQQTTPPPPSQKLHHTWNCRIQIWIHKKVLQSSIPKNFKQFCYFNQLQFLLSFSNGTHARR